MTYKAFAAGWHRTVYRRPNDCVLYRKLADAVLLDTAKQAVSKGRVKGLLSLKPIIDIKRKLSRHHDNEHPQLPSELQDAINSRLMKGRELELVKKGTDAFAQDALRKGEVDKRVLRWMFSFMASNAVTAILADSCDYTVKHVIEAANESMSVQLVLANKLRVKDDTVLEIRGLHGSREDIFEKEFFEKRKLGGEDVLYSGGLEGDIDIAKLLPRGNFIVPFFATEEFKRMMYLDYGAFVPEYEWDVQRHYFQGDNTVGMHFERAH
jgi:hypothetical protein